MSNEKPLRNLLKADVWSLLLPHSLPDCSHFLPLVPFRWYRDTWDLSAERPLKTLKTLSKRNVRGGIFSSMACFLSRALALYLSYSAHLQAFLALHL